MANRCGFNFIADFLNHTIAYSLQKHIVTDIEIEEERSDRAQKNNRK